MLDSLVDKSTEVRQAAAYGIGVMAQFGQDVYADACAGKKDVFTDSVRGDSRKPEKDIFY